MNRIYEYRRHLPHFQSDYKAIFVTFSTHHRWILPPEARTITLQACLWGHGKLFTLHGVVIMPGHTHLVLTPLYDGSGFYSIAEIMQDIKSVSAHRINRALNRVGQIWQHESFDHVLRREESIVGARPRACEALLRIFVNLYRAPRFIRGMADIFQWASGAFGSACRAQLPSVPDDLVRKERPFLARDHLHQVLLDFLRILVARKLQPA